MSCNTFTFKRGETREISGYCEPKNQNEKAVIHSATFELFAGSSNNIVDSGNCNVDQDKFSFLFQADEDGCYELEVIVSVGKEVIKKTATIIVEKR